MSTDVRLEVRSPRKSAVSYADLELEFVPGGLLPLAATPENPPAIKLNWFPVMTGVKFPLRDDYVLGFGLMGLGAPLGGYVPPPPVYPERNPWRMREELFAVPQGDNNALSAFLNKWGTWGLELGMTLKAMHHGIYRPHHFCTVRDNLRQRSVLPAKKWLETAGRLPAWNSAEHPVYVLNQGVNR